MWVLISLVNSDSDSDTGIIDTSGIVSQPVHRLEWNQQKEGVEYFKLCPEVGSEIYIYNANKR